MNKQELGTFIDNYIYGLQDALKEPTLDRELTDFPIDRDKALYLLLPVLNEGLEKNPEIMDIMTAVGAIQAALDTHDRICSAGASSAEQQLTVLAGDHFSGIHYKILADSGNFAMIRELSKTIAAVNEQKAALHTDLRMTAESLLERLAVIESACISAFYRICGFTKYQKLAEYALTYIQLHRMADSAAARSRSGEKAAVCRAIDLLTAGWPPGDSLLEGLAPVLKQEIRTQLQSAAASD